MTMTAAIRETIKPAAAAAADTGKFGRR